MQQQNKGTCNFYSEEELPEDILKRVYAAISRNEENISQSAIVEYNRDSDFICILWNPEALRDLSCLPRGDIVVFANAIEELSAELFLNHDRDQKYYCIFSLGKNRALLQISFKDPSILYVRIFEHIPELAEGEYVPKLRLKKE